MDKVEIKRATAAAIIPGRRERMGRLPKARSRSAACCAMPRPDRSYRPPQPERLRGQPSGASRRAILSSTCSEIVSKVADEGVYPDLSGRWGPPRPVDLVEFCTPLYIPGDNPKCLGHQSIRAPCLEVRALRYLAGTRVGTKIQQQVSRPASHAFKGPPCWVLDSLAELDEKADHEAGSSRPYLFFLRL